MTIILLKTEDKLVFYSPIGKSFSKTDWLVKVGKKATKYAQKNNLQVTSKEWDDLKEQKALRLTLTYKGQDNGIRN